MVLDLNGFAVLDEKDNPMKEQDNGKLVDITFANLLAAMLWRPKTGTDVIRLYEMGKIFRKEGKCELTDAEVDLLEPLIKESEIGNVLMKGQLLKEIRRQKVLAAEKK